MSQKIKAHTTLSTSQGLGDPTDSPEAIILIADLAEYLRCDLPVDYIYLH